VFAPLPKIGSLRLIIDAAEWLGLSSEQAEQISISNGSEILNLARIAIRRQDREALEQLFEQAARLTCTDLRIELFGHRGAVVAVSKTVIGGKNRVTLLMPEDSPSKRKKPQAREMLEKRVESQLSAVLGGGRSN